MISRYSREKMAAIWTDQAKFTRWLQVEVAVAEVQVSTRILPRALGLELIRKSRTLFASHFSGKRALETALRIQSLENELKHDVLAFTTFCSEAVGEPGRFFHYGLTSTDVVDTAMSLAIQKSGVLLVESLEGVLVQLKRIAWKYRNLIAMGRTHGMHAEPTVFGLRFLSFYEEMLRNRARLVASLESNRTGKLSGAVGSGVHISPDCERKILKSLGLRREPVSTQVLPRDRLAEFFSALAILASSMERVVTEIRHLSRSEVGEVREGFATLQKGSSAMPHKRNPVSSENLTGCARLLRSYVTPALEDVALWHERDISHSAVERVILPDAFILADYSLSRLADVLKNLVVDENRIREHVRKSMSVSLSGHVLLALVQAGASREEAYRSIQRASLRSLDGKGKWIDLLFEDRSIQKQISRKEVESILSEKRILFAAKNIFKACERDSRKRTK